MTPDTEKAGDFYTGLFGWGKNVQHMGPMTYTSFMNGERPAGGMYKLTPEMGEIPPNWIVYFAVDDCDAKRAKATNLARRVMSRRWTSLTPVAFAILQDPQGAAFRDYQA